MLEVIDLAKRYGPVVALDGASFQAAPGRIIGFLGPNGAGKTTTMRCIFGLASPDRGEVRWMGRPVDRDARHVVASDSHRARIDCAERGVSDVLGSARRLSPRLSGLADRAAWRVLPVAIQVVRRQ